MSMLKSFDFARLENGMVHLVSGEKLLVEGLAGSIYLADGSVTDSSTWKIVDSYTKPGENSGGYFDRLEVIYQAPYDLCVKTNYTLYHKYPLLSIQMTVTNTGSKDICLAKICTLRCEPPIGGVNTGFQNLTECTILDQIFYWTGHKELHQYLIPLANKHCAYWSTLVIKYLFYNSILKIAILIWLSIFIGWLIKYIVMRYGGLRMYRVARPIFLGIILGEGIVLIPWALVGFITGRGYNFFTV